MVIAPCFLLSPEGISEYFCSVQVNYRYQLESITANNQAYIHEQKVAVSAAIQRGTQQLLSALQDT